MAYRGVTELGVAQGGGVTPRIVAQGGGVPTAACGAVSVALKNRSYKNDKKEAWHGGCI